MNSDVAWNELACGATMIYFWIYNLHHLVIVSRQAEPNLWRSSMNTAQQSERTKENISKVRVAGDIFVRYALTIKILHVPKWTSIYT